MKYRDRNGQEIKAGMQVRTEDGTIEEIFKCDDDDLGIQATSKEFLKHHPDYPYIEYYPLYQFETEKWEIIK